MGKVAPGTPGSPQGIGVTNTTAGNPAVPVYGSSAPPAPSSNQSLLQFYQNLVQSPSTPTSAPDQPQNTPTQSTNLSGMGSDIRQQQLLGANPYSYISNLYSGNPGGVPSSQGLGQLASDNPNLGLMNMDSYYNQNMGTNNTPGNLGVLNTGLQQQDMSSMSQPAKYPDPNNSGQSYYGKGIYALIGG